MEAAVIQGYRVSPQQRRLWHVQRGRGIFFAQLVLRIEGGLDPEVLARALAAVVAEHESLRASYRRTAGVPLPVQVIQENPVPDLEANLVGLDFREFDGEECERKIADLLAAHRVRDLDLEAVSALRASLARLGEQNYLLVVSVPSLNADIHTLSNLAEGLAVCYEALRAGSETEPDDELIQYLQFSEWQLQLLEEDKEESMLRVDVELIRGARSLPFERDDSEGLPGGLATIPINLGPELATAAEAVANSAGVQLSTVLLASWQILLARFRGVREIVVAVPFDGRKYDELKASFGLFSKWLPVRLAVDSKGTFEDALIQLGSVLEEAESWQEYYTAPDGELTTAGFLFRRWPEPRRLGNLVYTVEDLLLEDEPISLMLSCTSRSGDLELSLLYAPGSFPAESVAYLGSCFEALLADASAHPDRRIRDLDLLGTAERRRLLGEASQGPTNSGDGEPFHRLFAAQAIRTPDDPAVICGEHSLTYANLDRRANRLAHRLRHRGVGVGCLVPLWLPRSPELVVTLLGILKAGAAYVPVDPAEPRERLARILTAVEPTVVVTQRAFLDATERHFDAPFLFLDEEAESLAAESPDDPGVEVPSGSLAYVLHTSGSSGRPKGVMVTHGGLANYLAWCVETYDVAAGGGAVVHSPIGFDLTITSLLSPLLCGGRSILLPEEAGIEILATALAEAEVALFKLTPSHLDVLGELLRDGEVHDRRRLLVVGGEALSKQTLETWWRQDPGARIVNEYGPTETVVGCCATFLEPGTPEPPSIGRPIFETRAWVLDDRLDPVPVGTKGELAIAGAGLARGYLGMPAATAVCFVPDSYSGRAGGRLYRTGDLVCHRLDGDLEFVGRVDAQVKIRGHRVEPAEIELALIRHPAVAEAVVLSRVGAGQGTSLLACFITREGDAPTDGELRNFLADQVPEYMIPPTFHSVAAFPLTANGKIDRKALGSLAAAKPVPAAVYVAPATEIERTLASIWAEVLQVERVGLYDNFFELGGQSLLMVQVFSRIKARLETEALMVDLFEFPTVSSMAKRLVEEREGIEPELDSGRAAARLESRTRGRDEAAAARIRRRRSRENV